MLDALLARSDTVFMTGGEIAIGSSRLIDRTMAKCIKENLKVS